MIRRPFLAALLASFALLVLACMGLAWPLDAALALAFGWPFYLARVAPEVRVDRAGLATALLCLAGFAAGTHRFLSWLYPALLAPEPGRWRVKWTAWVVSTVVLMFTAGLAAAGVAHQVGWLINAREPLLKGRPAIVVYRAQSTNNLKQIGLAWYAYSDDHGQTFPPGATIDDGGGLLHSWQTLILPYLDVDSAHESIDLARRWDDPVNASAFREVVRPYLIPGVAADRNAEGFGLSHYEGNSRVVGGFRGLRWLDVPDGAGTTIFAGEVADGYRPWGEPGHWRDPADGINRAPGRGFGGPFPGGADVLFLDGSVRFLKSSIHPDVFRALGTPDGGESLSPNAY